MDIQEKYMKRCLDLAQKGCPNVFPNPLVGSVIVYKDKIIGEGYHKEFGGPHAEVNAINAVIDKELLKESTLYVNLEPCVHHGKTPPCSDLIIDLNIPNVVIASQDPNPIMNGKGIEKLRNKGVHVHFGLLQEEAEILNKRFFTSFRKRRPYIVLKWAQTKNGFIADENYDSKWISNEFSRQLVHKWRSEEAAILVGFNTAKYDNPKLNVRDWEGKNPIRILIDKNLESNPELNLFDQSQKTIVFNSKKEGIDQLITFVKVDFELNFISQIMDYLFHQNIQSVIIEGGSKTINHFIESNYWDEARIFIGQKEFDNGIEAPKINAKVVEKANIAGDILIIKTKQD